MLCSCNLMLFFVSKEKSKQMAFCIEDDSSSCSVCINVQKYLFPHYSRELSKGKKYVTTHEKKNFFNALSTFLLLRVLIFLLITLASFNFSSFLSLSDFFFYSVSKHEKQ